MSSNLAEPSNGLKELIAERFRAMRGPRTLTTLAERMGCSHQRLSQIENGDVPESYLYLVRLHDDEGVDLNALLTAKEYGR